MTFEHIRTARRGVLAILVASALAACGGGSGGGGGDSGGGGGGPTDTKPTASIVFPPTDALATSNRVVIRGSASDDSGVAAVRVNGQAADSRNGFATWAASVDLVEGENLITVEVEDDNGTVTTDAASVTVTSAIPPMVTPTGVKLDTANDRVLVLSAGHKAIYAIDETTGERSTLSSYFTHNNSPSFYAPTEFDITADGKTAYVADHSRRMIFEVDLETGFRTPIVSALGSDLEKPLDIALDELGERLFVAMTSNDSSDFGAIAEIDLSDNDFPLTIIASNTVGSGSMSTPLAVEWDEANNRVLIATAAVPLMAIAPDTLVRTTLVADTADIDTVFDIDLDPASGMVYATDRTSVQLMDPVSGTATVIANATTGTGPLENLNAIAFDAATGRVLAGDTHSSNLLAVNTANGDRTVVYSNNDIRIGTGPTFASNDSVIDIADGKAYTYDISSAQLIVIDLASGERSVFNDNPGSSLNDLVLDKANGRILAFENSSVRAFDIETGLKTDLGVPTSMPPNFYGTATSFDTLRNRILTSSLYDRNSFFAISLDSLARTTLSAPDTGSGNDLHNPVLSVIDQQRNRLLALERQETELRAIDLTTGDRSTVLGVDQGLSFPTAMAITSDGSTLYAAESFASGLVRLDLESLQLTSGAGGRWGTGNSVTTMNSLAIDEAKQLAWSVATDSVVVMDLIGGDVIVISR